MFQLTDTPIDSAALRRRLERPDAGACVVFEGWVRNHHLGAAVSELHYEAFDAMARVEGETIVAEIEQRFPGCTVLCVHRTGALGIGDLAVWIGAVSAHRAAAFQACRTGIEEIKRRLPVWKKEFHPDGAAEWVNCTTEAQARGPQPADYHARQIALPEVGPDGQAALGRARVLIVGLGGLGCPAAAYLGGAGIGHLTLVDQGKVEVSNLARQILFTLDDVGQLKTEAAAAALRARNPFLTVESRATELSASNVRALVAGQTVVLDCTDNFATRFILHDACFAAGIPLVQAAVHRFEGTLDIFQRGTGGCLHCLRQQRSIAELDAAAGNCAGGAVFAPAVGVLGVMQAAEALKLILGRVTPEARHQTRLVNLLDGAQLSIDRPADPACPACGRTSTGSHPIALPAAVGESPVVIQGDQLQILSVRRMIALLDAGETLDATRAPAGTLSAPLGNLAALRELIPRAGAILACRHGLRSAGLARLLRAEGRQDIFALADSPPYIVPAPTATEVTTSDR